MKPSSPPQAFFDLVSAKLVDRTRAEAIYMGGFAVVASRDAVKLETSG
jgi:hypothetical protein